jgi:hypothetical protein
VIKVTRGGADFSWQFAARDEEPSRREIRYGNVVAGKTFDSLIRSVFPKRQINAPD